MTGEFTRHTENLASLAQISDIRASQAHFLAQASEIYDVSLGQKYIPPQDLLRYSQNPEHYVLLGSHVDQTLLGVALSYPLDAPTAQEINEAFAKHDVSFVLPEYAVGVIKSIAVAPVYRHRGIGTKLTIESMERLKDMSCSVLVAIAWDSGLLESSPKMFEKLGFQNVLRVENYWYEDSLEKGYSCPLHPAPPCECSAIFYIKK